jgi:hypothetical protein
MGQTLSSRAPIDKEEENRNIEDYILKQLMNNGAQPPN